MGTDFIDVEMQLLKEENVRLSVLDRQVLKRDEVQFLRDRNAELRKKHQQPQSELLTFMAGRAKKLGFTVK